MAATKSQGRDFTLFMAGLTAVCAGIAFFSSGAGKLALIVGAVAVIAALAGFMKIKPLEGKTGGGAATGSGQADWSGSRAAGLAHSCSSEFTSRRASVGEW